jgi:hypothetical protein
VRRLLAVLACGAAIVGALAAAAAGLGVFEPPAPNPQILPSPIGPADWKETRRYSVNRILIVEGTTSDLERAVEITKLIARPSTEAYDEVLVYVRTADRRKTRRVQWMKATGFRVLDY